MTYPTIRPELTLDFANSRQLDPRITFSRTSGATYLNPDTGLITLASEHEARFEKEGLLIEESRTNSVTTSGDVKTAAASTQTGTTSYVTGIAPDGSSSTTLTNWVPDSGATGNALFGIASPATPAAASVFIKANGWNYGGLWFNNIDGNLDGRIFIDLTTGEVLADDNMSNTTVVKCANGWWRVGGSSSTNSLGSLSIRCSSSSGSSVTPAMNGTDGILLWGLQTESGAFVTSLIPTAGQTGGVIRDADICNITGDNFSSWYNESEGTVLSEGISASTENSTYWTLQGSASSEITALVYPANELTVQVYDAGLQVSSIVAAYPTVASVKLGFAFKADDFAFTSDGSPVLTDTSGTLPIANSLSIGGYLGGGGSFHYYGHISRISYYSRRLTDLELQTITL